MFSRIFNPELFQGNLTKKHYFEGWYFKHVSGNTNQAFSVIPGISLDGTDSHSFIQVLNGHTGKTDYIRYPLEAFRWERRKLHLVIGNSVFSENGINLNIKKNDLELSGIISYTNIIKYPVSLFSPGIMGWYSFVPFMECYHGIVSVMHHLEGSIESDGIVFSFNGGRGYIEKDWGTSFPEAWIWIQSNNFAGDDISFSFSVAKIPWLGSFFIGFIGFLYYSGNFYLFSTYNRSKIAELDIRNDSIELLIRGRHYILSINVMSKSFYQLLAPVKGSMSRQITESVDSRLHLELLDSNYRQLYEGSGQSVGMEVQRPEMLKI